MCGRTDVVDTAHRAYSNVSVTVNCIQISHMIPLRYGNTSIRERLKSIQRLVNTNGLHVKIHHCMSSSSAYLSGIEKKYDVMVDGLI